MTDDEAKEIARKMTDWSGPGGIMPPMIPRAYRRSDFEGLPRVDFEIYGFLSMCLTLVSVGLAKGRLEHILKEQQRPWPTAPSSRPAGGSGR